MRTKTDFFYLSFFLVLFSFSVLGQPPFQTIEPDTGYVVESPVIEFHLFNSSFDFHAHVFNFSNGYPIYPNTPANVTCNLHLYHPKNGSHYFVSDMTIDPTHGDEEWHITVPGEYFTSLSQYSVVIYCFSRNLENNVGGFFEYSFNVRRVLGQSVDSDSNNFFAFIVLLPLIFGFILLFGTAFMDKGHSPLKVFAFLFSFICFLLSAWFGTIILINVYNLDVLVDAIGIVSMWINYLFYVVIAYFLLYIIWLYFSNANKEKKEKETLEY